MTKKQQIPALVAVLAETLGKAQDQTAKLGAQLTRADKENAFLRIVLREAEAMARCGCAGAESVGDRQRFTQLGDYLAKVSAGLQGGAK
jgi:hypothetical protein